MSIQAPQGILNIPNATLRVGKLSVDEVVGADTILNTVARNTILLVDDVAYHENKNWALKLPNAWAGEFECNTASAGNYSEFNFYNEGASSNAQGYNLTFNDTAVQLRYDGSLLTSGSIASTVTGTGVKKVRLMFERNILSVTVDGTLVFTYTDTSGPRPRVYSTTAGGFLNFFTDGGALKNLKIVNEKWISDGTSNIAYVGGGEVAVGKALAFNRVSNVSQIKVDSNVVTEYTGPHDRPLRKYPEVAMTSASQGGYVASGSSRLSSSYEYYEAFDGLKNTSVANVLDVWLSGVSTFDGSGDPTGTSNTFPGTSYRGEYCALKLPNAIKLDNFRIFPRGDASSYTNSNPPKDLRIFGSNDGTTWTHIKQFQNLSFTGLGGLRLHVNDSNTYNEYAFFVEKITVSSGGATYCGIGELELYGYEEGSGSLDTTLKTVYNVPATTGTQLEVYYDAKDLVDGAVTSVTDLSPNTNNGTVSGDPQVSNGAFVFDGVGDSIGGSITNGIGEMNFMISMWVKPNVLDHSPFLFGENNTNKGVGLSIGNSSTSYFFLVGEIAYQYNTSDLVHLGEWSHLIFYRNNGEMGIYRNGIYIYPTLIGSDGTLNLNANTQFTVGGRPSGASAAEYFNGSIANFRLYSKALNADQVKELYDYQKDYFLGSKSQVTLYKGHLGVGVTEPSGQLELAGDERIQEYPPRGMTGYETLVEGHGVFCVSASSYYTTTDTYVAWKAFDKTEGTFWVSDDTDTPETYDQTTGLYTGTRRLSEESVLGEYIILKLPYSINLKSFTIEVRSTELLRGPKSGIVYGRKNNKWEAVHSFSGVTYTTAVRQNIQVTNLNEYYNEFALVTTALAPNGSTYHNVNLVELRYFGTPGPTTLDKGSLTLGRSLDVPRVSRYDVDTETPRYEKLLVDFDTTVNSSPTDISGKGNHGTLVGATYSPADKAFVFDGTDDVIDNNLPSELVGDPTLTISMWVNPITLATASGNYDTFIHIGQNSQDDQIQITYYGFDGHLWLGGYGQSMRTNDASLTPIGTWTHICAVLTPGAWSATTKKLYINGELVPTTLSGSGTSSIPTASSTSRLVLGGVVNGSGGYSHHSNIKMSNPKLYNVALEPSEVKKLYNLGRTGRSMVISDTAVGIGKVPEAQLDVRGTGKFAGDVNFGGNVGIGTNNPDYQKLQIHDGGLYIQRSGTQATSRDYDTNKWITLRRTGNKVSGEGPGISFQGSYYLTADYNNHMAMIKASGFGNNNSSTRLEFFVNRGVGTSINTTDDLAGYFDYDSNGGQVNFTGQHRTFIKDVPFSQAGDLEGLIVSSDQNKYIKMDGGIETGSNAITISEALPVVSLSTTANDKKCFGVISASEDPENREDRYGRLFCHFKKELGDTRIYINSVGEGAIWITNINGSLESGDYITTSNVMGYGQKQDSDSLKNYTVAKITMDCDFDPVTQPVQIIKKELQDVNYWVNTVYENVTEEEYSILPEKERRMITETVYTNDDGETFTEQNEQSTYTERIRTIYQIIHEEKSKNEEKGYEFVERREIVNVLDEHGQIQWEDHPTENEKAYKLRYLTVDGTQTDEANAVYTAAFVGCTYHCG